MLKYFTFGPEGPVTTKKIAILVPDRHFTKEILERYYVQPLKYQGIPEIEIIALNLFHENGKISITKAREYLETMKPVLDQVGVEQIMCADSQYFKALTKAQSVDRYLGYRVDSMWGEPNVFYCPNHIRSMYDMRTASRIEMCAEAIKAEYAGKTGVFEESPILTSMQIENLAEIRVFLNQLLTYDTLTCDIETLGLHIKDAKIRSVGFAWSETAGGAFPISSMSHSSAKLIREWLVKFLYDFRAKGGTLIYHGGTFDMKVFIYELFMKRDPKDFESMLRGLHALTHSFEDTMMLTYLATNSAGGNKLSLKDQSYEYVGNYALDLSEGIANFPTKDVLKYNTVDACATWYVYNKYREIVRETQEAVYQNVFKPSMKTIIQMELVGLPINLGEVLILQNKLDDVRNSAMDTLASNKDIHDYEWVLRQSKADKANKSLKTITKSKEDFLHVTFNPGSPFQVSELLYEHFGCKVINRTKTKQPSVDAKTLTALKEHELRKRSPRESVLEILGALQQYAEVNILLSTFVPAFLNKTIDRNGWQYLTGNFNLGGTKSGRLSSSKPNLQNIPSTGTPYAKMVKKVFSTPLEELQDINGYLLVGADYWSLEDRISAKLTKDPNKLKVYTDGYDGHCLRAYSYFQEEMPDITLELQSATPAEEPGIINSIEDRYPNQRQSSKGPTFALTYMGTYKTLQKTFGFDISDAKKIEDNYHELYSVSDEWVQGEIQKGNERGYVDLAFGLRLRTPLLQRVVLSSYRSMPYEAYQEIKTAGNALGQSYGLLNSHAANKFMEEVWAHPRYSTWILPCAQIHDSQYYLVKNHLGCLKWVNDHLIKHMEWDDLEPIKHPEVGLGANLEVYFPDWSTPIKIPNNASLEEIKKILNR